MAIFARKMAHILEACCTSPEQAHSAIRNGAGRIELCSRIEAGGVTPPDSDISRTVALGVPVNVLVRPREGNFIFSPEEEAQMIRSIESCRELGAAGVVIGALTPEGDIDMPMMRRLVAAAHCGSRPLSVTFHRAFDECREPLAALEEIISLGCERLLTSGQKPSAQEGAELIEELVRQADGRIIVMPGAGITPDNLALIEKQTGAVEFHGTRICRK